MTTITKNRIGNKIAESIYGRDYCKTGKKIFFYGAFLLFYSLLLTACRPTANDLLSQAESTVDTHPDSALLYLASIDNPELLDEKDRMSYQLLLIEAKDKSNQDISADTVICLVKDYFCQKKDWNKAAQAAFYCSRVFHEQKNYPRATQAYLEAETIANRTKDVYRKGKIQHNFAFLYYEQALYNEAIPHCKAAAYWFSQSSRKYNAQAHSLMILGNCFAMTQQKDSANYYYTKGLEVATQHQDTALQVQLKLCMSLALRSLGDFNAAKKTAQQAIELNKDNVEDARIYQNLAEICCETNEIDSAYYYAELASQLLQKNGNIEQHPSIYRLFSNIEQEKGNYKKALDYYAQYHACKIVEQAKEEQHRVLDVQKKYDTERLQNENNQLTIRLLWIIIIVFILIIGVICLSLLIYRKQSKHRASLLDYEQQLSRLRKLASSVSDTENSLKSLLIERLGILKKINNLEALIQQNNKIRGDELLKKIKQIFDWPLFYQCVNKLHNGVFERLKERFPQLDDMEFKIACLTYAEFENKEIAIFLGLSPSTIQSKKNTMRRKLSIAERRNFREFLIEKLNNSNSN